MKKIASFLLAIYIIIPISVFAYSKYLIPSGESIGIELKSNNPIIVGSYNIGTYNALIDTDLKIGDKIIRINDRDTESSPQVHEVIKNTSQKRVTVTYLRNNKEYKTDINLYLDGNEYKTGLYIKDSIRGVATLTYIDADNKKFGALGHEIIERSTKNKFDMTSGSIYESNITNIIKSEDGHPGEKNALSNPNNKYGTVIENTRSGIFGDYTSAIPNKKMYKVATSEEINLGDAKMLTVINDNQVEDFDINILKINDLSNTKNILFEVTDSKLLEETGGIVQGMSGSPIIQGENIIGAVNYVLVDKTNRGYGIFITNMLEEAEN